MTFHERLVAISFRGPSFDHIRIAAANVVLLHHSRGVEHADIRIDPLYNYSGGFIHFGFLAVAVFFVISGFLVTPSLLRSGNIVRFASNRVLRIFPALIVVVVASMAVLGPILSVLPPYSYFFDADLYRYAKNVLTLTYDYLPGVTYTDGRPIVINGALWTLHFEVLSYGMLALTSVLGFLHRRILFLMLFLVSFGINIAMNLDPTLAAVLSPRFLTFIKLFVYFGAGATLFLFADILPFSKAFAMGALAMVMVALPFGLGLVVMPVCLPYIVIFCGLSALPGQPLLKYDLSYGVYLIHAPILVAIILIFPNLRIWWLVAMMVFLITLALSYLSWTLVERPALRQKKEFSSWLSNRICQLCFPWMKERGEPLVENK